LAQGTLNLHGWVYGIGSGSIATLDDSTGKMVELE